MNIKDVNQNKLSILHKFRDLYTASLGKSLD